MPQTFYRSGPTRPPHAGTPGTSTSTSMSSSHHGQARASTNASDGRSHKQTSHSTIVPPAMAPPPGIDFSAPVIRFDMSGAVPHTSPAPLSHRSTAAVLGKKTADNPSTASTASPSLLPVSASSTTLTATLPTKEQKLRMCFISRLPPKLTDDWVDRLLRAAGKLRTWRRGKDLLGQVHDYCFAEYDDPEHLQRAIDILRALDLARFNNLELARQDDDDLSEDADDVATGRLLITVDEMTRLYVEDTLKAKAASSDRKSSDQRERSLHGQARREIDRIVSEYNGRTSSRSNLLDQAKTGNAADFANPTVVAVIAEDDWGEIPEEHRELVIEEISNFRKRTRERELKTAQRIAQLDSERAAAERAKLQGEHASGPAAADLEDQSQLLRRNPDKARQAIAEAGLTHAERRQRYDEARSRDLDSDLASAERRWTARENARLTALDREDDRRHSLARRQADLQEERRQMLATFDDDAEEDRDELDFYRHRSGWQRARKTALARELDADTHDVEEESQELQAALETAPSASAPKTEVQPELKSADQDPQKSAPQKLKLTLSKQQDKAKAAQPLQDEVDRITPAKRRASSLQEIEHERERSPSPPADPERASTDTAPSGLGPIPTDRASLYRHPVRWDRIDLGEWRPKLRRFIGKLCVDVIGVEDDDIIDWIMNYLSSTYQPPPTPNDIEAELAAALGDQAEAQAFTIKVWRYLLILLESSAAQRQQPS
ncbi:hypothetical protein PYCC9005_000848 [Savitreella phatthalungensis]